MKHASSRRLIAGLAFACLVMQPTYAEPAPATPVGEWSFITGKMGNSCVLSGEMSVTRKADKTLVCRFTADWSCTSGMMKSVGTVQSCTAKQAGQDVVVTSKVEKITRSDPVELLDYMRANYAPDHFKVKLNTRGDEMRGLFHSYGQAEVVFRKHHDLIG
jgi:hypothetical protein